MDVTAMEKERLQQERDNAEEEVRHGEEEEICFSFSHQVVYIVR